MKVCIRGEAPALNDRIIRAAKPESGKKEIWLYDANTNLMLRILETRKKDKTGKPILNRFWYHRYYLNDPVLHAARAHR